MYGSNFCIVTEKPLANKSLPKDAEIIPLPSDDVTPPVTNTYFVMVLDTLLRVSKVGEKIYWNTVLARYYRIKVTSPLNRSTRPSMYST